MPWMRNFLADQKQSPRKCNITNIFIVPFLTFKDAIQYHKIKCSAGHSMWNQGKYHRLTEKQSDNISD